MSGKPLEQRDGPPLAELLPGLSTAVRGLARAAKSVPEASDIYYYKNIPEYKQLSSSCSSRAQALLSTVATHLTRPTPAGGAAAAAAADADEAGEALFERLTALLDDTYERLDTAVDASKQQSQALKLGGWALPQHSRQPLRAAARGLAGSSVARVAGGGRIQRHVESLARPQDSFPDVIDNSDTPWSPSRFPHLAAQLTAAAAAASSGSSAAAVHPFSEELSSLQYQAWQLQKADGAAAAAAAAEGPAELDAVPCNLVDTPEGLAAMVKALEGQKQLAIDLEHHSYRSYQGFTCLLQLSTPSADWVVDALALRGHLGPALQHILADPTVEKVLHGADNDILWLQHDFGLYIVNLFDTGQAARVLAYPSASLAHLLEHHVGFSADKRYQLADWRLRPLPEDMLLYARADTHFLLYVAERLKDELRALGDRVPPSWAQDLPPHSGATGCLGVVLERSRQLCLQTYSKPALNSTSHLDAALRWNLALPSRNMSVFGALYAWRDKTARALDESVRYVMPKGALIELARAMPTTAADVRKLLGKASGLSGGSGLLLSRAEEVAQVVLQGQQHLQQQQQPAAAAAAAEAAAKPAGAAGTAACAAAVVKPRELPAIVPRKVGAVAVKAVSVKAAAAGSSSSGMRGLFGKAGGTQAALKQQADRQQQQEEEEQQQQIQQPEEPQRQPEQQQQQVGQQQQQRQSLIQSSPPKQQQQQQQQLDRVGSAAAASVGVKPLPPARKSSSSLGGLFSRKRPAAAAGIGAAAAPAAAASRQGSFKLDFLTVPPDATAADGSGTAGEQASGGVTAAGGFQGVGGSAAAAADVEQQPCSAQRVSAADIRAAVDLMVAEDDAAAAAEGEGEEAAAAAAGSGSGSGSDGGGEGGGGSDDDEGGFGDLEYVPLSQQLSNKRAARRAAQAESKRQRRAQEQQQEQQQQQQQNGEPQSKRKGIFDGLGHSDSEGSSGDSDMEDGIAGMPSFDPSRLGAAAAAGSKPNTEAASDEEGGDFRGRGGRGRGRGRRGRGGGGQRGGGRQGRGSLAAVRRQQGEGGVGKKLFEVQDGPFKAARRKGGQAGRSRTFK